MDYNPLGIYEPSKPERSSSPISIRSLEGGRLTRDKGDDVFGGGFATVVPPQSAELDWKFQQLDSRTLSRVSPSKLLELLQDLSPEVSRGLWDFLRMCNPGWTITVTRPNSETPYKRGQVELERFLAQLREWHGEIDILFGRLFFSAWLRGAFFAELVLDEKGREPVDLVTPDPWTVRFRRVLDERRGPVWQMGQWQRGQFVVLDRPTVRYIPIDPFPNSPYGRPMASPALFSALFLLTLLHDLRRVVAQQGYPRIDLSVDLQALRDAMPSSIKDDPVKFKEWVDRCIAEITDYYKKLEPDDAYVHTSPIAVNRPVGAVDARSLGAVEGLIRAIERMLFRALKTMPLLMGSNEATSETHANRQWEIHTASIRSIQHPAEGLLSRFFGLGLQSQGIAAAVKVEFSELRASEELRDEQVQQMKLQNAREAYDNGLISQDEQAQMALGKEKADAPSPRASSTTMPSDPAINGERGSTQTCVGI